jgi:tetratricopeptide (TPR) repeat protein
MPTDPAPPMSLGVSESRSGPDARTPRRSTAPSRRGPRLRRRVAIAFLIAAGLLVAVSWFEFYPTGLAQAEKAYRRNNLEGALHIALAHLERRPFSRYAALLAARCLSRLGQPDRAEPYYQKAGSLELEDQHIRAYALVLSNRREPAIRAYQEILKRWPDDALALSRMAAVLISENRWGDVLEAAGRLIKTPTGAIVGHTLGGVAFHEIGDPEQTIANFDRVLALDPELKQMPLKPRSMFWAHLCNALLTIGRTEEARRHLLRAMSESDDPSVADLLGQSYYLDGEYDDAEKAWRLALEWDQNRWGTWWRIGTLQLQMGRTVEAIEPLRRSAALEPKDPGPLYSLSFTYRRLGRKEEAERVKEQADRLRAKAATSPQAEAERMRMEAGGMAR